MGPSSGQAAFVQFEDEASEIAAVEGALEALRLAKLLAHTSYDLKAFDRFRAAVASNFEIPWTGISPRMRRMIYAINAIRRPSNLVCAGIFCGYTFICNAGASIGDGAAYRSTNLAGIEILEKESALARSNVERFAPGEGKRVVHADAVDWLTSECAFQLDLLYIDAKAIDFDPRLGASRSVAPAESVYMSIVRAAMPKLAPGALVLAHNSVNAADAIADYLSFVRSERFNSSMNLIIDDAGIEVSLF
jgi:predicted O-methyltransferase YrrM